MSEGGARLFSMSIEHIDPPGVADSGFYHQVAVGTGSRMVFTAGQVAVDADGTTVGVGDLAAQIEQCYVNVAAALDAAGATFADVAKITVYVVDLGPEKMAMFADGLGRASKRLGVEINAPMTGIGVGALAGADYLAEIEAIAVLT